MVHLPSPQQFRTSNGVRIYRIACQVLPGLTGRVHLVLGAGPPTLVDAGSGVGPSTGQILHALTDIQNRFDETVRVEDIRRILLTHGHVDHLGGLADLLPLTQAAVGVHELEVSRLTAPEEREFLTERRMEQFLQRAGVPPVQRQELLRFIQPAHRAVPRPEKLFFLQENAPLEGGIEVLHTPGHAPGHVCLRIDDVLLSGDHILSMTIPQQWPEELFCFTGLGHYLESLEKIARLEGIRVALGGHEAPVENLRQRIEEIRRLQFRRLDRVLEYLDKHGPLTVAELAQWLYPKAEGMQTLLAIQDAGARIEYLHLRGQVRLANLEEVRTHPSAIYRYMRG